MKNPISIWIATTWDTRQCRDLPVKVLKNIEVKSNVLPLHAVTAHRKSRGKAPFILSLDTCDTQSAKCPNCFDFGRKNVWCALNKRPDVPKNHCGWFQRRKKLLAIPRIKSRDLTPHSRSRWLPTCGPQSIIRWSVAVLIYWIKTN
jgi:hypothetical protein